jgi:hypothetical protein
MDFALDGRARLSIELALTAASQDTLRHQQQEADARRLGMSGAEIDAARRGWSFNVQTSVAMALAIAAGDDKNRRRQHERALQAGIPEDVCLEIEDVAGHLISFSRGTKRRH